MIKVANEIVAHTPLPQSQPVDLATQTALTTWYLKPVSVGQASMAIFINAATMAPVLIPAVDILAVPATQLLSSILGNKLYRQGVPESKIDQYFQDCFAKQEAVSNTTTDFNLERTYQEYQEILRHENVDLMQEQDNQKLFNRLLLLMNKLVEEASPLVKNPFVELGQAIDKQYQAVDENDQDADSDIADNGRGAIPSRAMNELLGSGTIAMILKEILNPRYSKILDQLLTDLTPQERAYLMEQLQKFDK